MYLESQSKQIYIFKDRIVTSNRQKQKIKKHHCDQIHQQAATTADNFSGQRLSNRI